MLTYCYISTKYDDDKAQVYSMQFTLPFGIIMSVFYMKGESPQYRDMNYLMSRTEWYIKHGVYSFTFLKTCNKYLEYYNY